MAETAFNLLRFGHPIGRSNRSDNLVRSLNVDKYRRHDVDICMGNEQILREDNVYKKHENFYARAKLVIRIK